MDPSPPRFRVLMSADAKRSIVNSMDQLLEDDEPGRSNLGETTGALDGASPGTTRDTARHNLVSTCAPRSPVPCEDTETEVTESVPLFASEQRVATPRATLHESEEPVNHASSARAAGPSCTPMNNVSVSQLGGSEASDVSEIVITNLAVPSKQLPECTPSHDSVQFPSGAGTGWESEPAPSLGVFDDTEASGAAVPSPSNVVYVSANLETKDECVMLQAFNETKTHLDAQDDVMSAVLTSWHTYTVASTEAYRTRAIRLAQAVGQGTRRSAGVLNPAPPLLLPGVSRLLRYTLDHEEPPGGVVSSTWLQWQSRSALSSNSEQAGIQELCRVFGVSVIDAYQYVVKLKITTTAALIEHLDRIAGRTTLRQQVQRMALWCSTHNCTVGATNPFSVLDKTALHALLDRLSSHFQGDSVVIHQCGASSHRPATLCDVLVCVKNPPQDRGAKVAGFKAVCKFLSDCLGLKKCTIRFFNVKLSRVVGVVRVPGGECRAVLDLKLCWMPVSWPIKMYYSVPTLLRRDLVKRLEAVLGLKLPEQVKDRGQACGRGCIAFGGLVEALGRTVTSERSLLARLYHVSAINLVND